MNNEQLTAYLKDESYLYSLSFEELRTLVLQYPYAANLRILLLKKSYLEQNKDYDRHLQMASAYTTNRRFLYKALKKLKTLQNVPENVILGEDYLELTELSNIEKILSERHVTEVYSDKALASASSLQLDWGSAEFQNDDSIANKNEKNIEELVIPDMTAFTPQNLMQEEEILTISTDDVDAEVAQTIENIILEFGSQAIDLTGAPVFSDISNNHVTTLDALSDFVSFIDEDEEEKNKNGDDAESDIGAELPFDIEEITPREIPHPIEPLDFDALEDIKSPSPDELESESRIIEEEIRRFEELEDNSEFIPSEINVISPVTEKEDDDDMKRPEVEMEIVNQSKAVLVENIAKEPVSSSSQPSFSEWLKQFKMPAMVQSAYAPKTNIISKNQPTILQTNTPIEQPLALITETKHVLDNTVVTQMFEQPTELPDNLFGLNDSMPTDLLTSFLTDNSMDASSEELPKKKKKKKQMHELAAKSIEENIDLASETLADLLAAQGNIHKAIEMYLHLSLQIPEKSDYFAAKIEKLRIIT